MSKAAIKGVVFDLDNTLLDFMKMKEFAMKAAVKGMIEAGLKVDEDQSYREIVAIYEEFGWENQQVFDVFIEKQIGHVENKFLAAGVGQIKSAITLLPSLFNLSAASAILFDCLVLPSSEKSQSLAFFLSSSAFNLFAFNIGANSFAKVVFPDPGNPIIKIIFIYSLWQ